MIRVLIHSQDSKLQPLLSSALRPEFTVSLITDRDDVKRLARPDSADVLLLDFESRLENDEELSIEDDLSHASIPVVVMTSDLSRVRAMEFLEKGAYDCIRKPPSILELKIIIRRAYEHASMKREVELARRLSESGLACDRLVGTSGRARVVYDLIRRVSELNAFVLIHGESGTGKELVARAIHNLGNRAKEPFVAVSCGAIPESLIESELFGHEKGAFTGSTGARAGFLEQAGSGTLFLDEIGELSLATQVKLLRVLQEREFTRLGSSKLIPLNARVLFATHRDLRKMTEDGAFRRDLYFRVNVMSIEVPPLRERTEDIPTLAHHFLKQYAEEYNKPVQGIRPNVMAALVDYDWPGNIRELENVIQGAVIRTDGETLALSDLPEQLLQFAEENEIAASDLESGSFEELVRQFKVSLAHRALVECNGNRSLAARKLKVSRAYLHRLIRPAYSETEIQIEKVSSLTSGTSRSASGTHG
jgi:DNA-binding NtrC family response regulator